MIERISDNTTSHPQRLRSLEYVEKSINTEVKEIRERQRETRIRTFTDVSLMLLMILITVLAWLWFV